MATFDQADCRPRKAGQAGKFRLRQSDSESRFTQRVARWGESVGVATDGRPKHVRELLSFPWPEKADVSFEGRKVVIATDRDLPIFRADMRCPNSPLMRPCEPSHDPEPHQRVGELVGQCLALGHCADGSRL